MQQGNFTTVVKPHPFATEHAIKEHAVGATLSDVLQHAKVKVNGAARILVTLNGAPVPPHYWRLVRPKADAIVNVVAVPAGSGAKGPLGFLFTIASFFVPVIGPAIGISSAIGLTALRIGFTLAGALISGAFSKPSTPRLGTTSEQKSEPVFSITGIRNQLNPFGAIPRPFGRIKIFPPFAAKPFTRIVGGQQMLFLLFDCGYGPQALSNLRIGQTPITQFKDLKYRILPGWSTNERLAIYTRDFFEEQLSVKLTAESGFNTRRTQPESVGCVLDFIYPQGLVTFDEKTGNKLNTSVSLEVAYKKVGTSTWQSDGISGARVTTTAQVDKITQTASGSDFKEWRTDLAPHGGTIKINLRPIFTQTGRFYRVFQRAEGDANWTHIATTGATEGQTNKAVVDESAPFFGGVPFGGFGSLFGGFGIGFIGSDGRTVTFNALPGVRNEIRVESAGATWQPTLVSSLYFTSSGILTVSAASTASLFRSWTIQFPEVGEYDVRVKRNTADATDVRTRDEVNWISFKSFNNSPPIDTALLGNHVFVEMSIKASEQLSGLVDTFSCVTESYHPVFNGSTWTKQLTRNPAWAFVEVLTGTANGNSLPLDRVHTESLLEFAEWCDSRGYECNGVFDTAITVHEALRDIAAVGRGNLRHFDATTYGVSIDKPNKTALQIFTPRNIWNFQGQQLFIQKPDAIKVRYVDQSMDYTLQEVVVFAEGQNAKTAKLFETMELMFMTRRADAVKRARLLMAEVTLRPELFSFECDAEILIVGAGDRALLQHDSISVGSGTGRVVSRTLNGASEATAVEVDEPVVMEVDKQYAIRFRLATGTHTYAGVVTVAGEQTELTFITPISAGVVPQVGDLWVFGEAQRETLDVLITNIRGNADLSAQVRCVNYSPNIYNAENGVEIPDYDPRITLPVDVQTIPLPKPRIAGWSAGEDALILNNNIVIVRLLVSFLALVSLDASGNIALQVQSKQVDEDEDAWIDAPNSTVSLTAADVRTVEEGITYDFRFRYASATGRTSDWAVLSGIRIEGATAPPPDVPALFVEGNNLVWTYPDSPIDFAGFEIRTNAGNNSNWAGATKAHAGVVSAPPFDIRRTGTGQRTILIKALDRGGRFSERAAFVVRNLGDVEVQNIERTIDFQVESFSGATLTGGVWDSGSFKADTTDLFYPRGAALRYSAAGANLFYDTRYGAMQYTVTYSPAANEIPTATLHIDATVVAEEFVIEYLAVDPILVYGAVGTDLFYDGGGAALFYEQPIDLAGAAYKQWPGTLTPVNDKTYHFRITTRAGHVQGSIDAFLLTVDLPDIIERFSDVAIDAAGTRLTLTKTYNAIDSIILTLQGSSGLGGVTAFYADKQANAGANGGPLIKVEDDTGTGIAGTLDVLLKGH